MARTPHLSTRTLAHLAWAVDDITEFLSEFGSTAHGETRAAELGETGEFIRVFNMPLPDVYRPDHCDLLLITTDYPSHPPTGLYLLNSDAALVRQIRSQFHVYRDRAFYGAPSIPGYTWICFHYGEHAWRYRADAPARGDNLRKFLAAFFAELTGGGTR